MVWPVEDKEYGWRVGRIVDPFGHQEIGKPLAGGALELRGEAGSRSLRSGPSQSGNLRAIGARPEHCETCELAGDHLSDRIWLALVEL